MKLPETVVTVTKAMNEMNRCFKRTLFDEWAIISGSEEAEWLLHYVGPREVEFKQSFVHDFKHLHKLLEDKHLEPGAFEFTKEASGTGFDAILALAPDIYLVCNNTEHSMQEITADPLWRVSQGPFVSLSERYQVL
ncbi:MAG: hypothetical protein SFY80_17315 [Verrucomicrobiota bacterium]|nr:hypothetical protein [Verrucomicrobiota bacterium]